MGFDTSGTVSAPSSTTTQDTGNSSSGGSAAQTTSATASSQGSSPQNVPSGSGDTSGSMEQALNTLSENQDPSNEQQTAAAARLLGEEYLDHLVKVVVNGETRELPLKEVIKINQTQEAAAQRLEQAKAYQRQLQQQHQQLMQLAQQNPDVFFEKVVGKKLDDIAVERLAKQYELQNMDPREREFFEQKQKLEEERRELERWKEEKQQAEYQREMSVERENLDREFYKAWAETKMPKNPYFLQLAAAKMYAAEQQFQQGLRDSPLQPAQAAAIVMKDFQKTTREVLDGADTPTLLNILGPAIIEKIRQHEIQKVTGKPAAPPQTGPPQHQAESVKPTALQFSDKSMNEFEYREWMNSLKNQMSR